MQTPALYFQKDQNIDFIGENDTQFFTYPPTKFTDLSNNFSIQYQDPKN